MVTLFDYITNKKEAQLSDTKKINTKKQILTSCQQSVFSYLNWLT
ncbi:hypothetical protein MGAS10270_Spy0682 [Streptococcus pyogenes MGAS10270]|nr:hypothetical protein MGAS10270_Spy0682 [Streptococcus pyogenes MGAS10270]